MWNRFGSASTLFQPDRTHAFLGRSFLLVSTLVTELRRFPRHRRQLLRHASSHQQSLSSLYMLRFASVGFLRFGSPSTISLLVGILLLAVIRSAVVSLILHLASLVSDYFELILTKLFYPFNTRLGFLRVGIILWCFVTHSGFFLILWIWSPFLSFCPFGLIEDMR